MFLGILNYKNKIFLGDSGSYLLSSIIGCTFIYQYNYFDNYLYGDEIFIILLIPSIDMLRLFVVRSLNKKTRLRVILIIFIILLIIILEIKILQLYLQS